jgi:hypothetical protein
MAVGEEILGFSTHRFFGNCCFLSQTHDFSERKTKRGCKGEKGLEIIPEYQQQNA